MTKPQLFDSCSSTIAHLHREYVAVLQGWPYARGYAEGLTKTPCEQGQLTKYYKGASLFYHWCSQACLQH